MWKDNYQRWKNFEFKLSPELRKDLLSCDDLELQKRFNGYSEFGTGGIRSLMGAGTNRLNVYTIARATTGLARYIENKKVSKEHAIVVISFDTRLNSKKFAYLSANILASFGITVYLSDKPRPTPELSYLVRFYNAFLGIMITASHNSYKYNGYKVYNSDGGQITLSQANEIKFQINSVKDELGLSIDTNVLQQPFIHLFGSYSDYHYLKSLGDVAQDLQTIKSQGNKLKIVYTPLHGTGETLVTQGLHRFGFNNLFIVSEQSVQDPYFSTVKLPNPEYHESFALALKLAKKVSADIVIATDPDADRMGLAVKVNDDYKFLSGNQLGAIFVDYLINKKKSLGEDLSKFILIKTIVTSDFGKVIAQTHGVKALETLTGFKFIGEQVKKIDSLGSHIKLLIGYEESFGFLISPFVRDKDSIQAVVLASEISLINKINNQNLYTVLESLEKKYGYFYDKLLSYDFNTDNDKIKILNRVNILRKKVPDQILGLNIAAYEDYQVGERVNKCNQNKVPLSLPKSNVLKIFFSGGSWLAIRPSGTEPKIKTYISVRGKTDFEAKNLLKKLVCYVNNFLYK